MKVESVIENQIKRARQLFEGFGPAFDRPKEIADGILVLGNICDVLIRIIENQQAQIEQHEADIEALMNLSNVEAR